MKEREQNQAGYQIKINFNPDSVVNKVSTQAGESLRLFAFMTEMLESKKSWNVPDVKNTSHFGAFAFLKRAAMT